MRRAVLTSGHADEEPGIPGPSGDSSLVVKSIRIHHRRTSVRLEPEMWNALYEVAEMEGLTIHDICAKVDDKRARKATFSSALRVYLLRYYRNAARGGIKARRLKTAGGLV
ncbi:MAG: ribbon-helix-helix domain-containing protein [Alphaproteobacteria bacterium]